MSTSAAQAAAFYTEVLAEGRVWTIRDEGGFPAPLNGSGIRAMPFWSKQSRATRIIKNVAAYEGFEPVEIGLDKWLNGWLPDLERDGLAVGLNWAGKYAQGYDLSPADVIRNLAARESLAASKAEPE